MMIFNVLFTAMRVKCCLKSCFSNNRVIWFWRKQIKKKKKIYYIVLFLEQNKHNWFHYVQHCIVMVIGGIWTKGQHLIFLIIYSHCFLHWWSVTTISQKALLTLQHHKYFSVNNSYFSVPIIDKCWLECCVSTQSWSGTLWVFETIWKYYINSDGVELTSTVAQSVL